MSFCYSCGRSETRCHCRIPLFDAPTTTPAAPSAEALKDAIKRVEDVLLPELHFGQDGNNEKAVLALVAHAKLAPSDALRAAMRAGAEVLRGCRIMELPECVKDRDEAYKLAALLERAAEGGK